MKWRGKRKNSSGFVFEDGWKALNYGLSNIIHETGKGTGGIRHHWDFANSSPIILTNQYYNIVF
jgi:hypothetical protein